jgi:hypothetical protein
MNEAEQLRRAVRRLAGASGRVSCKALLALAVKAKVSPRRIGRLCDQLGVKIVGCQLGCFR